MAAKQMVFDEEARRPLAAGVEKLARAVRSTLGPRGRNAVLDKGWGSPKVTKDGVTVAEDIELDDPTKTWAPNWSKKPPARPMTSRATAPPPPRCWPKRIFREGLKMIAAGADPMALGRGIQKAVAAVSEAIAQDGRAGRRQETRRACSKSPRSRATTIPRSATCWPTRSARSARTA